MRAVERRAYGALGAAGGEGGRGGGPRGSASSGASGARARAWAGGDSTGSDRSGGRGADDGGSGPFGGPGSLRYEQEQLEEPPVACIVVLDSIRGYHGSAEWGAMVRRYCQHAYESLYAPAEYRFRARRAREEGLRDDDPGVPERFLESPDRLPVVSPTCTPQQDNNVDCGAYAVEFARLWMLRALGPHVTRRVADDGFERSVLLGEDDMMAPGGIPRLQRQLAGAAAGMAMDKARTVDAVEAAIRRLGREGGGGTGGAGD